MKSFKSLLAALNALTMMLLFVWLSNSMQQVEGLRNLKEEHSLITSVVKNLVKQRAYSGPSHSGRGH
ncbi:hypothetical protein RND71_041654 [Anisodus tanguticus]|uniref:Uncharacterized protein n=1 Tax=Anisodus tanguticus TaxID=243964 RepID=A0AAE1URC2_9SOLA|nr:hypothetical protein RND71_041654 [Anisodus tanguticus]